MRTDKIKEAKPIAEQLRDLIVTKYNLEPIKIRVKEISRGWAYYDSRAISIPIWAYLEGLDYFRAYVLHELGHFINYDTTKTYGHNDNFKRIEKELLAGFGLVPIYKRVYLKALKNDRGDLVWVKKGYEVR
jgi:predicted SprT family Zn-dependent metalloprotease